MLPSSPMAYERCLACGSSRLSPVTSLLGAANTAPTAHFGLKNAQRGFFGTHSQTVQIGRVCLCGDCGYAAFFASEKFDPDALTEF